MQRIDEQIVEVPFLQITKGTVEDFPERICEQIVDVPVPQVDGLEALQSQVRANSNEIQQKFFDVDSDKRECVKNDKTLGYMLHED